MAEALKGAAEMRARLARMAARTPDEVGRALYEEALVEAKEMMRRCPVAPDGGVLRGTIETQRPVYSGRDISVSIVCGGPAAPYATAVHEHLSEHSPPSWQGLSADEIDWNVPGTGPKFMQGPLLESKPFLLPRVARRIDFNRAGA